MAGSIAAPSILSILIPEPSRQHGKSFTSYEKLIIIYTTLKPLDSVGLCQFVIRSIQLDSPMDEAKRLRLQQHTDTIICILHQTQCNIIWLRHCKMEKTVATLATYTSYLLLDFSLYIDMHLHNFASSPS